MRHKTSFTALHYRYSLLNNREKGEGQASATGKDGIQKMEDLLSGPSIFRNSHLYAHLHRVEAHKHVDTEGVQGIALRLPLSTHTN